jgi:hypothetical protein
MTYNETPRVRSLLRQAERNVESGKYVAAEELYLQIVDEFPESAAAWLGLSEVARDPSDRQKAYTRALELAPEIVAEPPESPSDEADARGEENGRPAPVAADVQFANPPVPAPAKTQTFADDDHEHRYEVVDPDEQIFCYRHPNRSTSLRCYKCGNPICSECTVKTPVGYLCPECYRNAEDAFFNARPTDYLLALLVALPISLLAGFLVMQFSRGLFFIIIMFFAGGFIGGLIGRVTKRVIGGRRGRYIPYLVAGCVIIGVLIWALPLLLMGPRALYALIGPGIYLATAVSSAYYWAR